MNNDIKYLVEKLFDDNFLDNDESTESDLDIINNLSKYKGQAIDLGLPSGTLWGDRNLGAKLPEDNGDYFAWGDVKGYKEGSDHEFDWNTYKFLDNKTGKIIKYNNQDKFKKLQPEDDAAMYYSANAFKMPSLDLIKELFNNCSSELTYINNKSYLLLTSHINDKTLIIPYNGYYTDEVQDTNNIYLWLNSLMSGDARSYARNILGTYLDDHSSKYIGMGIRPVKNK